MSDEGRTEPYALDGAEIETRHDEYVEKLKNAVKVLKERGSGSAQMRPMDSDNPIDSPDRWDI